MLALAELHAGDRPAAVAWLARAKQSYVAGVLHRLAVVLPLAAALGWVLVAERLR